MQIQNATKQSNKQDLIHIIQISLKKVLFMLLGSIILFLMAGSIQHISIYARMTAEYTQNQQYWTFLGMIVLLICMCAFSNVVTKMEKNRKWVVRILWLVLFLGEALYMVYFYCYPTSDSAEVVNAAIQVANGDTDYLQHAEYFQKYGNNNLLTIATTKIYQISQFICNGKIDYILLNNLINIILLNASVYLGYRLIKKCKGEKNACNMLLLSVLNPVMYMSISWYYSATISIFFSMCILYLAIISKDTMQKKIMASIGIGICAAIGYSLRPTVIITAIAAVLVSFFKSIERKDTFIDYLQRLGIGIIIFIISMIGIHSLSIRYIPNQSQTYPITHWISMGTEGDGTNSSYGENYPKDITEKKQRKDYDIDRIKRNLSQYNGLSFGKHLAKKLYINWCDGSSAMIVKLKSDIKFSKGYYTLVSQRADGWLIYCQAFRATTYLLILFSLVKNFKRSLCKEDILYLNAFGAFLFYLIWEVKSDYSIPFLMLFFCIASDGMDWHRKIIPEKVQKQEKKVAIVSVLLTGMAGILLFWNYREFYTKRLYDTTEDVIAMNGIKPMKTAERIGESNTVITQNIRVDNAFNTLKLYCKKRKGNGTYTIGLYRTIDGKSECVQEWKKISGNKVQRGQEKDSLLYDECNEKGYLLFSCDNLLEKGNYILKITPDSGNDSIAWYYNPFMEFDYYEGTMFWNQVEKQGELALCLAKRTRQKYF